MLKFILTVILIIMVLRMLARLLMPVMVSELVKKAQRNMNQNYNPQQPSARRPVGDINVDYAPPSSKKKFTSSKEGDDFVDFEEIK